MPLVPLLSPLVLASASPRRRCILSDRGYQFEVRPAEVDERPENGASPATAAREIALRKALAVARGVRAGTVIGADTIVVGADGTLLGKPRDAAEARAILRSLAGTTHRVITGVALVHRPSGVAAVEHETTRVTMRRMDEQEIEAYVASGESFGKAGAYAIQEHGDRFVTRLDGDYDNVVGFPAARFAAMLARLELALGARGGER
ncbi:MAG: septum formation protein Maf [Planctomycetes bacterium]|nr:septum formation protein Maf [Planctomycetota bacterium]